jgi:Na+/H+ antiporter NhaD/arsenite permease-like protein
MSAVAWYTGIPFVVLLLLIAVMPLAAPRFWERNRNKGIVTVLVSLPILIYLLTNFPGDLGRSLEDYIAFIILLAALFIISGGIVMTGDLRATPKVNTLFLLVGAVLANFIGTTGASMVLIRPLLRTNSERRNTGHVPVFFIFVVSNIGGCLTPVGDPPLFLGYLKGVPFLWTLSLILPWLVALTLVLGLFYLIDRCAYRKERPEDIEHDIIDVEPIRFRGLINLLFLVGVILAVALQIPSPYRELIMTAMALLSLWFTSKQTRSANRFTFHPIIEVAVLFAGIFVTMVPLLMLLHEKGAALGITRPWQFFWLSGSLSSFLDNAPTYLTFFSLAESVTRAIPSGIATVAGVRVDLLAAISCGAVFMGANSYIGNGPNFMVKSIAEEQKVPVPHFFGYMAYSALILLPIFLVVTLLFFRG